MFYPRIRHNPVTAVAAHTLFVNKAHGRDAEVGFFRVTGWAWFWRLHESERGGMRAQKFFNWVGRWHVWNARRQCHQKLEKFFSASGGKPARRVTHAVDMKLFSEIESGVQSD